MERINLSDKRYYTIKEVSELTSLEPSVLRYWETQFPQLRPVRRNRQRMYREKDIELILKIKEILYKENYTIAGAKKRLKEERLQLKKKASREAELEGLVKELREELVKIKSILEKM